MALDLSLAGTSATQLEDFREEKIEVVVEDDWKMTVAKTPIIKPTGLLAKNVD